MQEYDLPFEQYKKCPVCNGYGNVNISGYGQELLEIWQERLQSPVPVINGNNPCYRCNFTGQVYCGKLEELELEE